MGGNEGSECTDTDAEVYTPGFGVEDRNMCVIHDVPKHYTDDMLVDLLDAEGFAGRYDFARLAPSLQDPEHHVCACVRFFTEYDANSAKENFEDFTDFDLEYS